MIIYIDYEHIEQLVKFDEFETVINLLMLSYSEGKHFIAMSPKTLSVIIRNIKADAILRKLKMYSSDYNTSSVSLLNFASFVCQIVPDDGGIITNEKNVNFLRIGIHHFIDSSIFQKTVLLGENIVDSDFYNIIGQVYLKKNNLSSLLISYKPQGGGGSTTVREYSQLHKADDSFCLCIIDSDIKYPNGPKGSTSKALLSFINSNQINPKIHAEILEVHEIENLIPRDFYIKYYEDQNRIKQGNFYRIDKLLYNNPNLYKYVDFKNGYNCLIQKKNEEQLEHQELREFAEQSKEAFWMREFIANTITPDYDVKYIHGYGDNIIENFVKQKTADEIGKIIENELVYEDWKKIGKIVFSFCLGTTKKLIG